MHQAALLCHSTELKGRGALWVSLSKAVGSRLESCCEMRGLPLSHCSCALSGWLLCRLCKREASVKKAMTHPRDVRKALAAVLGGWHLCRAVLSPLEPSEILRATLEVSSTMRM